MINPYQPPPQAPAGVTTAGDSGLDLKDIEELSFRGALSADDVKDYLYSHDHVGCLSMLFSALGATLTLLVFALVLGAGVALMVLGALGWLGMTMATSLVPYRRRVFISANPTWDAPHSGSMNREGISLSRGDGSTFYRWEWFGSAVIGRETIGFQPALHPHQPLIISLPMLRGLDDWDRMVHIAKSIGNLDGSPSTVETRRYNNRAVIRMRGRPRSIDVPDGGIPFEGVVSMSDLRHLPSPLIRRNRPPRAYLLIVVLAICASVVFLGVARAIGLTPILPTYVLVLVAVAAFMLFLVRRLQTARTSGDTIYYLTAFADERGITSDFTITVSTVPWSSMQNSRISEDCLVLSRRHLRQFIVARRDMFTGAADWQEFLRLVSDKLDQS